MASTPPHYPFELDKKHNQDIFTNVILPEYQANIETYTFPRLALVAGQPGAGKTQARIIIRQGLKVDALPLPVEIDLDELRGYHHITKTLDPKDVLKMPGWTNEDAYRWVRQLLEVARASSANVLYENTLKSVDTVKEIIDEFAGSAYAVDLHCMAVNAKESLQSIFIRFIEVELLRPGRGRWVPPEYHNAAYDVLPQNAQLLEDEQLVELIAVYSRTECIARKKLVGGSWELDASITHLANVAERPVSAIIAEERNSPWSSERRATLNATWQALMQSMREAPGFLREVIEAAQPYAEEAAWLDTALSVTKQNDAQFGNVVHISPNHVFVQFDDGLKQIEQSPVRPISLNKGDTWYPRPYPVRSNPV